MVDAVSRTGVAGASITFGHGVCSTCEPETVVTEADGSYGIAALPAATPLTFVVEAEDHPRQSFAFDTPAAPHLQHDFLLERGVEITGRVLALATASPIADARITCGVAIATTDGSGTFRLRVPIPAARSHSVARPNAT